MKKAITILAVLIVLVGAVFALDETHTIRVKADVTAVEPAIQLKITADDETYATNNTAKEFYEKEGNPAQATQHNYAAQADQNAIDVKFNLDQNGNIVAKAYLANNAKTNKVYTLAFSNGVFSVKRNGVSGDHEPTTITTAAGNSVANEYTVALGQAQDPTNKPVTVTFLGKTVTTKDVVLAQATYAYTADTTIDPNTDQNQWYYANIVLTVSTT